MLVISTQNWSILAKFAKKNPAKSAVFYWLFLGEVSPRNFPWNRPIFLRTCPSKSFEIWLFSLKSREIGWFFCQFWLSPPAKSADFPLNFAFFSREISRFSTNSPLKILRNFAFFSAKYQKPCLKHDTWPFHYVPVLSLQSIKTNNWSADNL